MSTPFSYMEIRNISYKELIPTSYLVSDLTLAEIRNISYKELIRCPQGIGDGELDH